MSPVALFSFLHCPRIRRMHLNALSRDKLFVIIIDDDLHFRMLHRI